MRTNASRSESQQRKDQRAKEILHAILTKRVQTSYIFALAEIERTFGYLWGIDIEDESQLTEQQKQFYEMFLRLRKNIFDNGNNQLRAMTYELDQYDVKIKGSTFLNPEGRNE